MLLSNNTKIFFFWCIFGSQNVRTAKDTEFLIRIIIEIVLQPFLSDTFYSTQLFSWPWYCIRQMRCSYYYYHYIVMYIFVSLSLSLFCFVEHPKPFLLLFSAWHFFCHQFVFFDFVWQRCITMRELYRYGSIHSLDT